MSSRHTREYEHASATRRTVSLRETAAAERHAYDAPMSSKVSESVGTVGVRGKPGPVLLVEHDDVQRAGLGRILRGEGHEVLEASEPEDVVAMAQAFDPDVVVVSDGPLGIRGQRVLTALAEDLAGKAPPTVLLTASEAMAKSQRLAGAAGLSKPFRVEDLLDAVQRFRRSRKPDA